MRKDEVIAFYKKYRANQMEVTKIEGELLRVTDQNEWVDKLIQKSSYLRDIYQENKQMVQTYILSFTERKQELTDEIAVEYLNQIIDMLMEIDNDSMLTSEMLKVLQTYFLSHKQYQQYILATFFMGISYADKVNSEYRKLAFDCFDKVCRYTEDYCAITDWNVRRRILFSFINRIINYDVEKAGNRLYVFQLLDEAVSFLKRLDVRELDHENMDFDELIEECNNAVIWKIVCSDDEQTDEVIKKFQSRFLRKLVTLEDLYNEKSCYVVAYLWYYYWMKQITSNQVVTLLFNYYCNKDKEIDYTQSYFYDEEEYQVQMVLMQEILRYLAKNDCTLPNKDEILNHMSSDFKRLYTSVPYVSNNAYLNADLVEIMNLLLRLVNEEEAFRYIQEVVMKRNTMTLIHSTMVNQITKIITACLIENQPQIFIGFMGLKDSNEVAEKKESILNYATKASYIHDLGKTRISDIINLQTRKLTEQEYHMIKKHPMIGIKLIEKTPLEEKYQDFILGHHKYHDGSGGYPESFDNTKSKQKILIDIITIGDCIDAATDMLGRNYTIGKLWMPTVQAELLSDNNHRYNKKIVDTICSHQDTTDQLQYLTGSGRFKIYYDIYQDYISNK